MADTQLVAAAGEHYVAYKVASLGFVPALVRQGVRGIDLIASSPDGSKTVGLQIKVAWSAVFDRGNGAAAESFHLRFPLGQRAIAATPDSTIFCFVDLRKWSPREAPDVYLVSARQVKREYDGVYLRKYTSVYHERSAAELEPHRNNWRPLIDALSTEEVIEKPSRLPTPVMDAFGLPTAASGARF